MGISRARVSLQFSAAVASLLCAACMSEPPLRVAIGVRPSVARPVLKSFSTRITASVELVELPDSGADIDFDVLWDLDPRRVERLKREAGLAPIPAPLRESRPARFRDPDHLWISVTADVRVIVFDPQVIADAEAPTRVGELSDARSANQLVLADPASASSAWHAAALRALGDGSERLFSELPARGARIVSNEHEVLPVLLKERRALALVDGSAAFQARERGQRLGILIPDQDDRGAVLRSSVVALTHSGAARAEARDLVAYLLSAPVGRRLGLMTGRLAFLESDEASGGTMRVSDVVSLPVSQAAIADQLSAANRSPPPES